MLFSFFLFYKLQNFQGLMYNIFTAIQSELKFDYEFVPSKINDNKNGYPINNSEKWNGQGLMI